MPGQVSFSGLPIGIAPAGTEIFPADQSGGTVSLTITQLSVLAQGAFQAVDSGAANAYVLTTAKPLTVLNTGQLVAFSPAHPNTGASTVNLNGGGNVAAVDGQGNALTGGEIVGPTIMLWTGAQWEILWQLPLANKRSAAEIAALVTPVNYAYPPGHVYRYGTNTTPGTTDMTNALNNSIKAVGSGGTVIWPGDIYLITSPILAENLRGLTIQAASGQYGFAGTRIQGNFTVAGKAILSMVGSLFCTIGPITLEGVANCKTGLLLGRSSSASASNHKFYGVVVSGNYTVAGVYNVASEENDWFGCYINPLTAPFAGMYMSGSDGVIATIGGLTASSMEAMGFFGGVIGNQDSTAGSAALWIDASVATGHIHCYRTFFNKGGGDSNIFIRLGLIDGQGTKFPIGFHDCFGEIGSSAPSYGLHIHNATATNPLTLTGLVANIRFQQVATNHVITTGTSGSAVQLEGCTLTSPYDFSLAGKPSVFQALTQCSLDLQYESAYSISGSAFANFLRTSAGTAPTIGSNAGTNTIMTSGSGGAMYLPQIGLNGATPPAQVTGWGTPTGLVKTPNFPGATATLAQCSGAIAQLINDLKALGLYGA